VLLLLSRLKLFYHKTIRRRAVKPEDLDVVMKEIKNEMAT